MEERACDAKSAELAFNCFVIKGGQIAVSDEAQLVRGRACTGSATFAE